MALLECDCGLIKPLSKVEVNLQNEYGNTPLLNAIEKGDVDIVKFLLQPNALELAKWNGIRGELDKRVGSIVLGTSTDDCVEGPSMQKEAEVSVAKVAESGDKFDDSSHQNKMHPLTEKWLMEGERMLTKGMTEAEIRERKDFKEKKIVDLTIKNRNGFTILILNARYGNVEILEELIRYTYCDFDEKTANTKLDGTHIGREDVKTTDEIMNSRKRHQWNDHNISLYLQDNKTRNVISINEQNNSGYTALINACYWGHHEFVTCMLKRTTLVNKNDIRNVQKASLLNLPWLDLNRKTYSHGSTALMQACFKENVLYAIFIPPLMIKIVETLLMYITGGGDNAENNRDENVLNVRNMLGNTSLMTAVDTGNFELCEMLVFAGCDLNLINNLGKGAKDLARENLEKLTFKRDNPELAAQLEASAEQAAIDAGVQQKSAKSKKARKKQQQKEKKKQMGEEKDDSALGGENMQNLEEELTEEELLHRKIQNFQDILELLDAHVEV